MTNSIHKLIATFSMLLLFFVSFAQPDFYKNRSFTKADTLRGMLLPERSCFDVTYYVLDIYVDPENRSIEGSNEIHFKVVEDFDRIQLDLYKNMAIQQVLWNGKELKYTREYNAFFIDFPEKQLKGTKGMVKVFYGGKPKVARRPPWDGGFVWEHDSNGKNHIGVACEGDGASLWWPNKDHLSDEPDSMSIICTVPGDLMCVANGNLRQSTQLRDNKTRFEWFVSYPINNYNVSLNIADYAHFDDVYTSPEDGAELALDFYVLKENLEKAKIHFKQVHQTLAAFEKYFGKYPFWNDGYALVETPYLGMEHQGAIAYGNHYMKGYLGQAAAGTTFDYIIVHETGHEYFGNSISCYDLGEMWIHESFTTYMEALFVEYDEGYETALRYLGAQKFGISNKEPIIGPLNVNFDDRKGGDIYNKGAWVLHTLRNVLNNDDQWFKLIRSFHETYKISNVTSEDWIKFVNDFTGQDFTPFMDQYLRYPAIPTLEYNVKQKGKDLIVEYRLDADVKNLSMPIKVGKRGAYQVIDASADWQKTTIKKLQEKDFQVAGELFLIKTKTGGK